MLSEEQFNRLKLEARYQIICDEADFIASRLSGSFNVHLFALFGFYVEVWQQISINHITYIEIQKNESILREYLGNIDLNKDLGL